MQLFVSQHVASVSPPVRRLKRFARVTLGPGETRSVGFQLTRDDLTFVAVKLTQPASANKVELVGVG